MDILCQKVYSHHIQKGWRTEGLSVYSLLLISDGSLAVEYNGKFMELHPGDLHLYAPGMPTVMMGASDDYEGYLLNIPEKLVADNGKLYYFLQAAYLPVAEYRYPKITLTEQQQTLLKSLFTSLMLHLDNQRCNDESILRLLEVIGIDLLDILHTDIDKHKVSSRSETIFARFLQLIPDNAVAHHDIAFYADKLNITTTYLSRIVRRMSGRTVMSFIEYALTNVAIRLLIDTDKSITDIAWQLNFSDQSSFSRFFTRQKGMSPLNYRKRSAND